MKTTLLSLLVIFVIAAGCSSTTPSDDDAMHTGDTTHSDVIVSGDNSWSLTETGTVLDTTSDTAVSDSILRELSPETQEELKVLYKSDAITFSNSYQLGDSIITNYKDGMNQAGSQLTMVVTKINNQRVKLYEWNSGEISCSIINKFWFPQSLLEARYGQDTNYCTLKAEYTIPAESWSFIVE